MGEVIIDKNKQLERWIEHYSNLYCVKKARNLAHYKMIPIHPDISEHDNETTEIELSEAIDILSNCNTLRNNNIIVLVLNESKEILLPHRYNLLFRF